MNEMDVEGISVVNFVSEECAFVPDNIRKKLEETLVKMIDSLKCDYERKISLLEKSVLQLQQDNVSDKLMEADLKVENLTGEVTTLQASCERLKNEKDEMQKQMEDAVGKYESLANMIRNYDMQINHWKEKCATMTADFEKLNCEYCDVLDKYMSVKGLEVDCNRRLTEAQSEWENLSTEIRRLQAEIDNLTTDLKLSKDESKTEKEVVNSQLMVARSELNNSRQCIEELKLKIDKGDKVIEKLSLKLKQEREDRIKQVEALERENMEQAKMTQLYKQRMFDNESKLGDVAGGHKELLELIKYGEKRCKSLESELLRADYNCRKHEENVNKLEKEVDRLNVELAKSRSENVTRSIDELYPLIGAGRQLLKNDISFTEMLRQYSKASDEIFALKEENLGLKHSIERIVKEIEAKAPYLRLQKEEYRKALQIIDDQVRQVDEIKEALLYAEEKKKQSEDDRRISESVVMDLSKQVQYLTVQLDSARRGTFPNKMKYSHNHGESGQGDTVFSSIEDLQGKNLKLLKEIKMMSEKEREFKEEITKLQKINEEKLLNQQEKYRQLELSLVEYKEMSCNLRQQLKVYQNLYKNKLDSKLGNVPFAIAENTMGVQTDLTLYDVESLFKDKASAEEFAKELQEKTDTIEKERVECGKQLEELRLDVFQTRGVNSMLRAELDHAKETFNSLTDTKDFFKKQAVILENQCKEYAAAAIEREKEINRLNKTLKIEQESGLRKANSLHHSQREYMALLEKEKRLRNEYEQLKQCDKVLLAINSSIQVIKASVEKKMTASQEQLGTDMISAIEECSVLRRLLQDKHKELDKLHSEKEVAVKLQLEQEDKFNEELGVARREIERQCLEINTMKNSLNDFVLQKNKLVEENKRLLEELASCKSDMKECAQCKEYQERLSNLTVELEKLKSDAVRNEEGEELSREVDRLKEKLSQLEQRAAESITQEIEKEKKLKSQEEKLASILELGKQMNVDKELSMHSEAMVELMKDVTAKSDEIFKLKVENENALSALAEFKKDFNIKEKNLENECTQLKHHVSSLEAKNSLLCEKLAMLDSQQQLTPREVQSPEPSSVDTEMVVFGNESSQPLAPDHQFLEIQERKGQQEVKPSAALSVEDVSKPESITCEVDLTVGSADDCTVVEEQPYVGETHHCGSVIAADQKQTVTTLNETKEAFHVDMPESFGNLEEIPHYSSVSHTSREEEIDDCDISEVEQQRVTMDFRREEREMRDCFDVEGREDDSSPRSEEERDFTVLQPMPPFEYVSELSAPEEIDLTISRGLTHPPEQMKRGKERQLNLGRSTASRPRGSGTARRSRGTFKNQRKRSSSVEEQPSLFTKVSRKK